MIRTAPLIAWLMLLSGCSSADSSGTLYAKPDAGSAGGASGSAGQGGSGGGAGGQDAGGAGGSAGLDASSDGANDAQPPSDAQPEAANPCEGVTCNQPPANECADTNNLKVYNPAGTCDNGTCSYGSSQNPCQFGCANNACTGDPCVGVSCNTSPENYCADPSNLAVYEVPGSCSDGTCTYGTHQEFCKYGCTNDICNGDPCVGQSCATPPTAFCSGPENLTVYDVPGTCKNGACTFTNHEEYCAFGCESGGCKGDPCAGVSCGSPPAAYCAGPDTLRTFASSGTCTAGSCTYPTTDVPCSHGCQNGKCKDCATSTDCTGGKWCDNSTCTTCDSDQHCGSACTDCVALSQVCNGGTGCVQCTVDSHCGAGSWCDANVCTACDTAQHCGSGCVQCSGASPACTNGACECTNGSCPANQQCTAGSCAVCKSDQACGATCVGCASPSPKCLDQGATSKCVECLANTDCTGGKVCNTSNACVDPGCPPPADSCTTGTQNRSGCANARIIGRKTATTTNGYKLSDSTCYASDKFDDSSGCWDANSDHAYRLYMRQGETASIDIQSGWDCASSYSSWNVTLQIWGNSGCGALTCTNKLACQYNNYKQSRVFVAPADGWYIIVVDGSSAFDDEGDYTFTVKLTCKVAGCECP
jgi:Cys-rich repeat protein